MIRRPLYFICFFIFLVVAKSMAQDTLPRLTVKSYGSKVIISWRTTYGAKINTINIQRSTDSLRNFTSIGSVLEPMNRENGYVDGKAPAPGMFYRVFVAFEGGRYLFTKSYKPFVDTSKAATAEIDQIPDAQKTVPNGFVPSRYIFTGRDNNVVINLADAATAKYSIKFFDEKDNPVFEIHKINDPYLIIEKVNFLHAGWFYFMLYDNGILKEKNQFYIPKEGKYGIPPGEVGRRF